MAAARDDDSHTVAGPGPAPARAAAAEGPVVGAVLDGRFQLEAVVGRGGSGVVFRAFDRVLGEPLAVKVLNAARAADQDWIRRLVREVKVARATQHPNILRIFELVEADGHWIVTMELASGTLAELLRAGVEEGAAPRPWRERLIDARSVCRGLAAIHRSGITHRDVTPRNILRMEDGRLVISDFGLALLEGEAPALVAGTPGYVPPEVLAGARVDQRSDVWQLGLVLHEIVFGQRPRWRHVGPRAFLERPAGAGADTPTEALAELLGACLETEPDRRPPNASAVADALSDLAERAATQASRPAARKAVLGVVVAVLLAAALGVAARRARGPREASALVTAPPVIPSASPTRSSSTAPTPAAAAPPPVVLAAPPPAAPPSPSPTGAHRRARARGLPAFADEPSEAAPAPPPAVDEPEKM